MANSFFISLLVLLLAAILSLFSRAVQNRLRGALHLRPGLIWVAPLLLTGVFCIAAALAGAFRIPFALLALVYTSAPVLCAYWQGIGPAKRPAALDFVCVLLLWLPLEFSAGAALVPRQAQGILHSVAYGIAILLGLTLFLCFRSFSGMKYALPVRNADFSFPLAEYIAVAPVLAALGYSVGFIPAPHASTASPRTMAAAFGLIFLGTALPEEILFRGLIQNLLMQRFGETTRTLVIASVIFGCAHLNNGPQAQPNWRYAILASIAGFAYGKVFQKASSICSSALLHMLVDWTKHYFF
ncbi:MAG TPA: CPBP family intramembrane glutamic endopeptidase [Bryobacteraceae bacterium]|nr:CPBP family intramembrane glutamic endopeptidase [Bryobacteraceae bacterium]